VDRLSAWADLLDGINVFPVADADTGRNLVISLTPLRGISGGIDDTIQCLLRAARGNSGNIAARFFSEFLNLSAIADLPRTARNGRDAAWAAIAEPRAGTMLTVFDALADSLSGRNGFPKGYDPVIADLAGAVGRTCDLLPELKAAGVVDAGALGMFILLEGFFGRLSGNAGCFPSITGRFGDRLKLRPSRPGSQAAGGYCITALIQMDADPEGSMDRLSRLGESVVMNRSREHVKIHLHAPERESVRSRIAEAGRILEWSDETLIAPESLESAAESGPIHIMTDAAGSITRPEARRMGITLLDSYILMENESLPETHVDAAKLYRAMRAGIRVSTSQASVFQRNQHYDSVLSRFGRALYLCVGSAYTGNHAAALAWKAANDPSDRFTVIDSGAASGRLAVGVLATARYARAADDPDALIRFASAVMSRCEEYVFLDRLTYLAAGGRISRTGAFFGDMLSLRPVISPGAEGARKVGMVRDRRAQVDFARERLAEAGSQVPPPLILLEYSDNREWVETMVQRELNQASPDSEIRVTPLSLTSGVHMGPGTWGVAWLRGT